VDTDVILKRFEQPDEVREFPLGKFELVTLGGMTIGRATYQPGWKWSVHVGDQLGAKSCHVEHVGMVVSGRATAAMDDGEVIEMGAGDVFYSRRDMTAGSSATSPTCRCTSWAPRITPRTTDACRPRHRSQSRDRP